MLILKVWNSLLFFADCLLIILPRFFHSSFLEGNFLFHFSNLEEIRFFMFLFWKFHFMVSIVLSGGVEVAVELDGAELIVGDANCPLNILNTCIWNF